MAARRGLILAGFATLIALAGIALLVARPARVVGVDPDALNAALARALDASEGGRCSEMPSGRPEQAVYRCTVKDTTESGSSRTKETYLASVSDWGCWEAEASEPPKGTLRARGSGCIWLRDYVDVLTR
jgi:hypothetical protein